MCTCATSAVLISPVKDFIITPDPTAGLQALLWDKDGRMEALGATAAHDRRGVPLWREQAPVDGAEGAARQ